MARLASPTWLSTLAVLLLIGTVCETACAQPTSGAAKIVPVSAYWGGKAPDPNVTIAALPAPMTPPAGSPDDQAKALAAVVEAGGPDALPAILTALRLAGITVLDTSGAVALQGATPGQGIVLDQWQAVALGMFAQSRTAVRLSDLSDAISTQVKEFNGQPIGEWILTGLRTHYNDGQPQLRFMSRFIVELIRQSPWSPVDVTGNVTPSDVYLDGVAMELVLNRFAADILGFATKHSGTASLPPGGPALGMRSRARMAGGQTIKAGLGGACSPSESASKAFDAGAVATTTAFDQLTEWLITAEKSALTEGQILATEALKKLGTIFNMLAAVIKVYSYFSALNVKIDMQTPPPLKRTPSRTPGERKLLTATAKLDFSNAQMLNCFRIMLNAAGMDISVQTGGALVGSQVNWVIVKGGQSNGGPPPIVEFAEAVAGNQSTGDPVHQRTDENGQSTIGIEGAPQRDEVGNRGTQTVIKDAEVWALVQAKPPNISQDLIDGAGAAFGGIASMVTIPAEILLRSNLIKPAELPFKVIDWKRVWLFKLDMTNPCSGTTLHAEGTIVQEEGDAGNVSGTVDASGTGHTGKFGPTPVDVGGDYDELKHVIYLTALGGFGPNPGTGGGAGQYAIPSNGAPVTFPASCGSWTASADPGPPIPG